MPRLLDYLAPAYAWLVAIDPSLPRALFVALVFAIVLAWRKLSPGSWKAYSGLLERLLGITDEKTERFKAFLLKVGQALPSAAIGAVVAGLGTGDFWATFKLTLFALLAPLGHEFMRDYKGALGKPTPPPSDGSKPFGREVFPQDGDGKPLSVRPPGGFDAEFRGWRHREWSFAVVALALVGCGAAQPVKAPCDPATLAAMTAVCSAEAYACGKNGGTESECTAECDRKLEARAEECRK